MNYLKKSFSVYGGTPKAKPEMCRACGIMLQEVIYRLNREPRCRDCFSGKERDKRDHVYKAKENQSGHRISEGRTES